MSLAYTVNRLLRGLGCQLVRNETLASLQALRTPNSQPTATPVRRLEDLAEYHGTNLTEPSVWFEKLRKKWGTIPSGNDRTQDSARLLTLNDAELLQQFDRALAYDTQGTGFGCRGWYHELYRSFMPGKKVLDIGCGMAISTIPFAEMGAALTFVDVISDNVRLVERLCAIKGIQAQFLYMSELKDIDALDVDYDVVTAIGSLINVPLGVTRLEVRSIKKHLRPGGRWLHFGYPKSNWLRGGSVDFTKWGEMTDGPGTPWMEYHDKDKIKWLFEDSQIQLLFDCEFHDNDFNWFDIEVTPPAWLKGRPIENPFLSEAVNHNQAGVSANTSGILSIRVPGPRWAYAVTWPRREGAQPEGPVIVELKVRVSGASIGVGIVTGDFSRFVGKEVNVIPTEELPNYEEELQTVNLLVDDHALAKHVVLRNTDLTGREACVTIYEFSCFVATKNPVL